MSKHVALILGMALLAGPVAAQRYPAGTRGFVPGIDQPTRGSVDRAEARRRKFARRRRIPGVAPPSAISPGIRIIAPAR